MTAADTARHILSWAASDMTDAMPEGDLADGEDLAAPDAESLRLVGRLASVTAARLRLEPPVLGDKRPPSAGAAVVAAAVGAFRHERARALLGVLRPPTRVADLLAFHGVVAPAVKLLPHLGDQLRDLSPLTGVLDRPGPRTTASCESLLDRLRTDPTARAMIVLRFAMPSDSPEQSQWRGECLAYTRHEDPDFVVDVYETALLHYGREHEIRARIAWRHVLGAGPDDPALPTAAWWRALAELEAAEPDLIRGRTALERRRVGTNLFRRVQSREAA
ncbi:hypothetical protein [Actinocrispum wychmicini]|uniref:FtsH ternary system domain-containing protein n=1 Tax=Actinocrispum wychmicini TaxID=1213861 RepID=A0A4R2J386_9PSEU|nr:hypothetical protein [Actinocrispum wychmicini]TCO52883.1 hypothetical protein EV192_11177 [Actinocrispum wychmicini]